MTRPITVMSGTSNSACGVSDHADVVVRELRRMGLDVTHAARTRWRMGDVTSLVMTTRRRRAVTLIAYPTLSYRASIVPHVVTALSPRAVVLLHEWSIAHPLRRLAVRALLAAADGLVTTTVHEAQEIQRSTGRTSEVVPIFSNFEPIVRPRLQRVLNSIGYFGRIAPNKGIEEFLTLAERSAVDRPMWRFRLVGQSDSRLLDYAASAVARARATGVHVREGLEPSEISREISTWTIGYLPFPDGASERRGTLLAVLSAGVPVVTTEGPATTAEVRDAVWVADDAEAANRAIERLLHDAAAWEAAAEAGRLYATPRTPGAAADALAAALERVVGPLARATR